jgi:hypothetical protein
MLTIYLRSDVILKKGFVCMFAKLAVLLHSKIALAIVGATLVAGTGAVVASAATGQSPASVLAFANRQFLHTSNGDNTSSDDHGDACDSQHQDITGAIASIDASGTSFTLIVKHGGDESDSHDGTPTARSTPTTTTPTVTVNAQTTFAGAAKTFAELTVGMEAEVRGASQSDGSLLASAVVTETSSEASAEANNQSGQTGQYDECDGQHQKTHGVIASINSAGSSFTLTLTVKHEADDDHGDTSDEHGTPTAKPTPNSTPTTKTLTVKVDAQTRFEGVAKSLADLKVGMQAEIGGTPQSDGSLLASKVNTGNNDQHEGAAIATIAQWTSQALW